MEEKQNEQMLTGSRPAVNSEIQSPTTAVEKSPTQNGDKKSELAPSTEGLFDLLKRAAEASLVFGALLYVIGWSYLDGYYATFALKVGQLGISNQEAALSSFKFIFHSPEQTVLVCIGILVLVLVGTCLYSQSRFRLSLVTLFLLIGLLLFAGLLSRQAVALGRQEAWNDMQTARTTLPRVQVEVDTTKLTDNLINLNELGTKNYRLLLQTETRMWIFKSVDNVKGVISVVTLPKEAIRVMIVERATPGGGGS